ncbi:8926_t:CDS:2 [Paraglomus occultum]|uniref:8926_t:CDS:1 n=1 Tax=Paraglomus occultum TaxID=144539 RepID=A0A9N9BVP5_9GLOM|nr:8926_t:CDS:2 [Paraglomus occultum]
MDECSKRHLFTEIFGDSDSEDDFNNAEEELAYASDDDHTKRIIKNSAHIHPTLVVPQVFPTIPGLCLCREVLTDEEQKTLIDGIIAEGYFSNPGTNQAMCFGTLPSFIVDTVENVLNRTDGLLPKSILLGRRPVFDQFRPASEASKQALSYNGNSRSYAQSDEIIPILLRPGDVLGMSGEARYNWEHAIEETLVDEINGERIVRSVRVSITLRKMKERIG